MRVVVDADCLIAAVLPQHQHHAAILTWNVRHFAGVQPMAVTP
jgi:hypothetical protein